MYQLHTKKQRLYFDEVIRLHYEEGMGEDRISRILPVGHSTVSRWIAIFAREDRKKSVRMKAVKPRTQATSGEEQDKKALEKRIKELEAQLKRETLRADFYDEMINVAEAKFNIPIRKKAGAKR